MTVASDFDGVKTVLTVPLVNPITKVDDVFKLTASDDDNSVLLVFRNDVEIFNMDMAMENDDFLVGEFPAPNTGVHLILKLAATGNGALTYGETQGVNKLNIMGDNGGSTGGN